MINHKKNRIEILIYLLSVYYCITKKYKEMKKIIAVAILVCGLVGLVWLAYDVIANAINSDEYSNTNYCKISEGVVEELSQKTVINNIGDERADITFVDLVHVNGREYEVILPQDQTFEDQFAVGDTVYLHQFYGDRCLASKTVLSTSEIETVNTLYIAVNGIRDAQWKLFILIVLLIIILVGAVSFSH